jgi:hypothetical protein
MGGERYLSQSGTAGRVSNAWDFANLNLSVELGF